MRKNEIWTQEEINYLCDNWGVKSINTICKNLSRSKTAVNIKVQRYGLGAFLNSGEYITFSQLIQAVTGSLNSYSYKTISWIKNRNFPVKNKKVDNNQFKIVYIEDFWKWAEQNRSFIDFSKMEENILGKEPKWVKEQRKQDVASNEKYITTPWTKIEDDRLSYLLKQFKYSYDDISKKMCRTCGAIQRRISDLELKERPIKIDNHKKWSLEELNFISESIKKGKNYEIMAEQVGRSSKAVRGVVYSKYKTENLDKVRNMIKDGTWGYGAPVPTVNQDKRKADTKKLLADLAGLLIYRRDQISKNNYMNLED